MGNGRIKAIVAVEVDFVLSEEGREILEEEMGMATDKETTYQGFEESDIVVEIENELPEIQTDYGTFEIGGIWITDKFDLS